MASIAAGSCRRTMASTSPIASIRSVYVSSATPVVSGTGSSDTVAAVTTPSVPSLPANSRARLTVASGAGRSVVSMGAASFAPSSASRSAPSNASGSPYASATSLSRL